MSDVQDTSAKRRALLELLLKQEGPKPGRPARIPRREHRGPAPLSFAQERLWFLDQYHGGTPLYNLPVGYPLNGPLDVGTVRATLNEIVKRHEVLRTTFVVRDGRPVQAVAPELKLDVPLVDLSGHSDAQRAQAARKCMEDESLYVFDLATGPLLRATLIRLSDHAHIMFLVMHHIVSDGWSMEVFVREFNALLSALQEGRAPVLADLPIQYRDFAVWQREWVKSDVFRKQLGYWKDQLAGSVDSPTALPTDHPRPLLPSFSGSTVSFRFPSALSAAVRLMSREAGTTLFMTMLAAFKALLFRYTDQRSVVVGFPTAARTRTEVESLVGFFVNTLVLRTDITPSTTFRQHLGHVKQVVLDALANQDVPFERLVEEFQPQRSVNTNPLFQVMFDFKSSPSGGTPAPPATEPDELTFDESAVTTSTSKFDLTLAMTTVGDQLSGTIEYSTDLFEKTTIMRLVRHLRTLLDSAVSNPDAPIANLAILPAGELHQLVSEWNDTIAPFPDDCLHERFERQVRTSPDAVAAVFEGGKSITYAELNAAANRLARYLRDRGVGPEAVVGICMDGSLELVMAILAVHKAGGAYLPLDPSYPRDRLAFMVEDAGVRLVITQQQLVRAAALGATAVVVDDPEFRLDDHDVSDLPPLATARNTCFVIYTSGSTGRPKGVVIEHRGIVNLIHHLVDHLRVQPDSRIIQFTSFSFDVSAMEMFVTLFRGATIFLERRESLIPGPPLAELLQRYRITHMMVVPSVWAQLPDVELPHLVTAFAGGEPVTAKLVERWAPGRRMFNGYGPTEISIASSVTPVFATGRKPTIGRPVPNVTYHVVDDRLQPCPIGQVGELLIGGVGVGRGYLRRPGLTAERFIPDAFSDEPGARAYRTGDLVRRLPNGEIDCLGRMDLQVKIHGFRIELGEIEAVLTEHPSVGAAAVTCSVDARGEKRLSAYVVPADGAASPSTESLRLFLATKLPAYMIPQTYTVLDELPLLPSGKLDALALPSPDLAQFSAQYVAPRDPLEQVLSDVWAEVLGTTQIGVHDNFFERGGHSLLVTQIVSRLRDRLEVEVPVRFMFEAPTVAELALLIEADAEIGERTRIAAELYVRVSVIPDDELDALLEQEGVVPDAEGPTTTEAPSPEDAASADAAPSHVAPTGRITRRADRRSAPLSFGQERLWFLEQLEPGTPRYNVLLPIQFPGAVDVLALERSLQEIVRRHEALRTVFRVEGAQPVQVVIPSVDVALGVSDLRRLDDAERSARMTETMTEVTQSPFDLAEGPLFRAHLFQVAPGQSVLAVVMHHIVTDAWSLQVLQRELSRLYEAFSGNRPSPLEPLPLQYGDYAVWQRERLQGDFLAENISFWLRLLDGAPASLDLPIDRPRPTTDMLHSSTELFRLPAELCARLESLAHAERATLYMAFVAMLGAFLHRETGQTKIVVGTPVANRQRAELEPLIGLFTNTLVFCTDLSGRPTLRTLLRLVREMALGAYGHQEFPFERLVEEVNPERNLGINPIFQVMFAYQDEPGAVSTIFDAGQRAAAGIGDRGVARFELMLYLERSNAGVTGALEYATELFDRATIQRMARSFSTLVEALLAEPDRPVSDAELLGQEERHALLVEWSGRAESDVLVAGRLAGADVGTTTVHELVQQQAARTPDAVALAGEGGRWTYAELDRAARARAHRLARLGVGPDVCVGLCMNRSAELPLTILAILEAGGAYLPLDPSFPRDRLAFMAEDAGVPVVIADQDLKDCLPDGDFTVVWADELAAGVNEAAIPLPPARPDSPAYVIYTSGSTGVPKGVVVTHRTLTGLLGGDAAPGERPARTLQFSSPSFDVSLQEILGTWVTGGTLVCVPEDDLRDFARLLGALREHTIERLFLPPVALQRLAETAAGSAGLSLRQVITAGEQLKVTPALRSFFTPLGDCRLVNQYGPSETHVVTEHRLGADRQAWPPLPPIGRPVAHAVVYVLDRWLHPVPIGNVGELYISGPRLARGYLRRPGLTAERFLPDPFGPFPGGRMYRTGDLVRYRTDGTLEFVGRVDHQLKVRGFRVEPGEIEAALTRHAHVADAVVAPLRRPKGDVELVAYVVPAVEDTSHLVSELRDELRASLPDYMMPSRFVFTSSFPLTPTGKVDRARLPDPGSARPQLEQPFVAPRSPLEDRVAEAWKDVLGIEQVGIHDNFFELGGHSLLATQLVSRLQSRHAVDIPLRTVFEAPTVAGMALAIVAAHAQDTQGPDMVKLLSEIEGLSDGEVDELLIQEAVDQTEDSP